MARALGRYANPLVTPSVIFLLAQPPLFDDADELAELLEDACGYKLIYELADFVSALPAKSKRPARMVLMPAVANNTDVRCLLYEMFLQRNMPCHYFGCIALTGTEEELKAREHAGAKSNRRCDVVTKDEKVWLAPEFTCVSECRADLIMLKRFIATLLPFLLAQ